MANTYTLLIEKDGTNKFRHTHNGLPLTKFSISDFECSIDGNLFKVIEKDGAARFAYLIANITVKDNTDAGTPETFANPILFEDRLRALGYTPFFDFNDVGLTTDQYDAINEAAAPSASNPFATIADVVAGTTPTLKNVLLIGNREVFTFTTPSTDYVFEAQDKGRHIYLNANGDWMLNKGIFAIGDELVFDNISESTGTPVHPGDAFVFINGDNDLGGAFGPGANETAFLKLMKIDEDGNEYWNYRVIKAEYEGAATPNFEQVTTAGGTTTKPVTFNYGGYTIEIFDADDSGYPTIKITDSEGNIADYTGYGVSVASGDFIGGIAPTGFYIQNSALDANPFNRVGGANGEYLYTEDSTRGIRIYKDRIRVLHNNGFYKTIYFNTPTGNGNINFPDVGSATKTVAMTDDIPVIDAVPTDASSHAVSSNGVFDALANKADLVSGLVPSSQLPSFVDDVVEGYKSGAAFYEDSGHTIAITGVQGKIYVDLTSGQSSKQYRWSGSIYIQITNGLIASTDDVSEGSNLYFTTARVLATVLTGISFATGGAIVSTDTVLQAFGKIQKQINDLGSTYQALTAKDDTGGYVGLTLFKINFKNVANTFTSFFTNSNTASRTYTFQDRNGTIADDTDISTLQTAINSRVATVIKDVTVSSGVNSTLSETILVSYLIPANTFAASDVMKIVSNRFKSGGLGGTITYRHYINTSNSLSGATLIGGFLQSGATQVTSKLADKTYTIAGGNIEGVFSVGSASNIDSGASTSALGSVAFNVAANFYFIVTAQLGSSNLNNARQTELLITH